MSVSSVSSSTSSLYSNSSSSSTSSTDTTDFLQLLVAQLQNQNPLDPTDTSEFTSQLMSYASYDEQVETNDQLSELTSTVNSLMATTEVGLIGQTVEAYGDTTSLTDGEASWGYSLDSNATEVSITVKDADGNTVYEADGETGAGKHTFTWDGTKSDGTTAAEGSYSIEVNATDADGESVYGYTTISGTVTGIDSSSGTNMLQVGGSEVSLSDIIAVGS